MSTDYVSLIAATIWSEAAVHTLVPALTTLGGVYFGYALQRRAQRDARDFEREQFLITERRESYVGLTAAMSKLSSGLGARGDDLEDELYLAMEHCLAICSDSAFPRVKAILDDAFEASLMGDDEVDRADVWWRAVETLRTVIRADVQASERDEISRRRRRG
jgi:hypothetical protein